MAKAKQAKVEDIRSLDDQAIADKISEQEMQLKKLKFSHSVNPIENPLTIRALRREIARHKTEITRRRKGF